MKRTLITATLLASVVAFAQTETTTAPATTEAQPAAAAPAPAKKAAKKATKKKKAAPSAAAPAAMPAAPVAEQTPAAPAMEATAVAAPAAGTSTAVTPEVQAPKKKWGVSASSYGVASAENTEDVQILTSFAASYQITEALKFRAKQTFETLTAGPNQDAANREIIEDSNFRPAYADFSVSSSLPGILGSNKMPVSLNYKFIGGDAIYSTTGGYSTAHSFVEANWSIPYTLSPKWELSIDTQIRHVAVKVGPNSNRILAIPTVSYAINDEVSLFQTAGMIWSTKDNERLRKTAERVYLATGVSVSPLKGLSVDVDVYQDKAVALGSGSKYDVTPFSLYKSNQSDRGADATFDDVGYEATVSYSY